MKLEHILRRAMERLGQTRTQLDYLFKMGTVLYCSDELYDRCVSPFCASSTNDPVQLFIASILSNFCVGLVCGSNILALRNFI